MSDVFRKLNLKDQSEIVVLNAPVSFELEIQSLTNVAIRRSLEEATGVAFSLAFVTTQGEVDRLAPAVAARAAGDSIVWFAYPKGSSRNYKCEINRDSGWKVLGACGFEPVRMVAIDADWSAIRFRRAEFIKAMSRGVEWTVSEVGRQKAAAAAKKAAGKKTAGKKTAGKKAAGKKAAAKKVAGNASRARRRRR